MRTLELGGKSPMSIMDDADHGKAVDGAVAGMRFTRQGQSCTAASRIFAHEPIHYTFVARLRVRVDAMKMGDPLDETTERPSASSDIGTIISPQQFDKVTDYIRIGEGTPGMHGIACSKLPDDDKLKDGLFVRPVIFVGAPMTRVWLAKRFSDL